MALDAETIILHYLEQGHKTQEEVEFKQYMELSFTKLVVFASDLFVCSSYLISPIEVFPEPPEVCAVLRNNEDNIAYKAALSYTTEYLHGGYAHHDTNTQQGVPFCFFKYL